MPSTDKIIFHSASKNKKNARFESIPDRQRVVHPNGVEPSRHCWHKNLNLACLPISPRVREKAVMYTHLPKTSQRPKPKKCRRGGSRFVWAIFPIDWVKTIDFQPLEKFRSKQHHLFGKSQCFLYSPLNFEEGGFMVSRQIGISRASAVHEQGRF